MNNDKANLIATLAHAANNLRNVTNADAATNAILASIVDLARPGDRVQGEVGANEHQECGEEYANEREPTKLELITEALRAEYPPCHCGECPAVHVLVQAEAPVTPADAISKERAESLGKIITKPGADHVFVARAKELLAAAGYAIVTL